MFKVKMSTSPYSLDLRERVIKYIETGKSQVEAARIFSINIMTVNKWYLRYRKEGHYLPRVRQGAKSKINREELEEYVIRNPNSNLKELSKRFGIGIWGIYYWLRKLGFSYKKKPLPMWKRMRKEENNIWKR